MPWENFDRVPLVLVASVMLCWFLAARGKCEDALPGLTSAESLLDDEEFVREYVAKFPVEDYKIYEVESVGKFYLKSPDKVEVNPAVIDLVKNTIRRGEVWEQNINLTMRTLAKPGSVAVDVGAHIGAHTVVLSKLVGPEGKVYAFEPQLERYRHLCKNLELNGCDNAVPLRYAVGDKHEVIEILREHVSAIGSGGEKAELRTLDSFGFADVSLIKIDVESYEDYVIDGAQETIRKFRPLLIVEIRGGISLQTASPQQRRQIEHTISKLEAFEYEVMNIGFHDYLAVPKERKREVDRALKKELGQPGAWERFRVPAAIFAALLFTTIVAVVLWRRQR